MSSLYIECVLSVLQFLPGIDICTLLLLLLCVCVRVNVYVCVCVCSDTPQGERACHDNKKSTLKKAQSQSLNSKNKLLHVHFWLTIHAKVETALKFRRHLTPKP